MVPEVIASDIFYFPHLELVLDGQRLPLADASLRAIAMTNVLHHLPDVRLLLRRGGALRAAGRRRSRWSSRGSQRGRASSIGGCTMSRASRTPPSGRSRRLGPLSSANQALPWIVFQRDAEQFAREFPQWRIETVRPMMPLRYLVSGGVGMRSLVPSFMFGPFRAAEGLLGGRAAMFAHVVLRRSDVR